MKYIALLVTSTIVATSMSLSSFASSPKDTTYRMSIPRYVNNLDPIYSDDPNVANVVKNIYSTLVTYRTEKNAVGQSYSDIVPLIVEDWNISSDRKVYNFKIKKNIYFHNGRKCTAYDVKHTFERLANPSVLPKSFSWIFRDMPIKGLAKFQKDKMKNNPKADLEGVKVLDDGLLQITLDKATPLFLKELTLPIFSIIAKEEIDKWGPDYGVRPVGTGPYKLENLIPEELVLEKNKEYFGNKPILDTLVYKVVPQLSQEYEMFEKDKLDQTSLPENIMDDLIKKENWNKYSVNVFDSTSLNNKTITDIVKQPKMTTSFLGINTQKPEFTNVKARQALNFAVDKSRLITEVLKYNAIPTVGVLPQGFPGSDDSRKVPYEYNEIKAKKLLFEAGFNDTNNDGIIEFKKKPAIVNFWYYQDAESEKVCEYIAENLTSVGFQVNLMKATDWTTFLKKIVSGQADLYHFKAAAKYADPDKFFTPLFDSSSIGKTNLSNFSDKSVDK
ncbi:MAG: ABC transporter substrate-binding protein, partial [Candidatus Sericytochromatia bacterium]